MDALVLEALARPRLGDVPQSAFETAQYTAAIVWTPSTDTAFSASTAYTASVTISPKRGWSLEGLPADSFVAPGASSTSNAEDGGIVTAIYPPTEPADYESPTIGALKYVPAGRYLRGSSARGVNYVSAFRMASTEITRSEFVSVMGSDPSRPESSEGTEAPVQYVSWYHAMAFCNKLSALEGLEPAYSVAGIDDWGGIAFEDVPVSADAAWDAAALDLGADGYRLPTQAEWLWAAMGAPLDGRHGSVNKTGVGKPFSGSDGSNAWGDFAVFGFYGDDPGRATVPKSVSVGGKLPNELGIYDLSGNVGEWIHDWDNWPLYEAYDYPGPAAGTRKLRYGHSWKDDSNENDTLFAPSTIALRFNYAPAARYDHVGFRVVRK